MSIVRLIHVKVDPKDADKAEQIWKEECAPLMIKQEGCISEELLKCKDVPGEYISYSLWESEQAIDAYRGSDDHNEIVRHSRNLQGAKADVKRYDPVA